MIEEDLGLTGPVISFSGTLSKSDPSTHPVLIIGQMKHLKTIDFNDFSAKFHSYVDKKTYNTGLMNLNPTSTDSVHLWLNSVTLAVLPTKCSRHNTPSRAHSISKLVKEFQSKPEEYVVMVCERKDVIASACAIAKTYPIFTRKTTVTKPPSKVFIEFVIVPETENETAKQLTENELKVIASIAESVRFTARIVDTPCNEMNVDAFIKEVEFVGKLLNIKPVIIRGEELKQRNMGGIYGVGKAASCPPALVYLSYLNDQAQETVAWVGKGIVYDTGGLSIKISGSMVGMKRDCGGAAAILGAFYAAVKCNFKQNLHAVFCLAENSVGPLATRPDDIHTLYSGSTVEINNTDAEGRLVMADGVAFAKKDLGANIILDMATLTGAQGVATGKFHAATITNNDDWEKRIFEAGKISGDLVFPLPYAPEMHFQEYKSQIADMKNSVADRTNAQVACAGLFVGHNVGFDYEGAWIHVDMAATSYNAERATGYGVALLITLFGNYMGNEFVQSFAPSVPSNK